MNATAFAPAAKVASPAATSRLLRVDHAIINHYSTFSTVSVYNEDGSLIGSQTFNTDGDIATVNTQNRAWRHSEVSMFGVQVTLIELAALDAAGEVQHFDAHGKIME